MIGAQKLYCIQHESGRKNLSPIFIYWFIDSFILKKYTRAQQANLSVEHKLKSGATRL